MFCVCTETTATVLAERERLNETERLRQLFDNAPGFMAVVRGPDHVFEMANASYQKLVGRRDLIGKPVREAVPRSRARASSSCSTRSIEAASPFPAGRWPSGSSAGRTAARGTAARLRLPADLRFERRGQRHLRRRL